MQMFTQCACILFDEAPPAAEVRQALESWAIVGEQAAAPGDDGWIKCGPGLVVQLRSGARVIVDVVGHAFPDEVGAAADAEALRSGMFGPTAQPGALARAKEQNWTWAEGTAVADRHRGFVRMRTIVDLPDEGPRQLPKGHDPVHELATLVEMAGAVLRVRGAAALFMPGGEALRSPEQVAILLGRKTGAAPPIELWLNLRASALGEEGRRRWKLVDVVGMGQMRYPDSEAVFVSGQERAEVVAPLLRNACLHLISGRPIPEGSTADDTLGRRWKVSFAQSLLPPARPVLRWLPEGSARLDEAALAKLRGT